MGAGSVAGSVVHLRLQVVEVGEEDHDDTVEVLEVIVDDAKQNSQESFARNSPNHYVNS